MALASCQVPPLIEPPKPTGPDFCLVSNAGDYEMTQAVFEYLALEARGLVNDLVSDRQTWRDSDCDGVKEAWKE